MHANTVINSDFVDFIISGQGDIAFPELIKALKTDNYKDLENIENLIFKQESKIITNKTNINFDLDKLSEYPYQHLNTFYPINNYISKTFLGKRTFSYHSSFGCPFFCSFCAVVPIFKGNWIAKSAKKMHHQIIEFKNIYGIDSIEFTDNNFFTSKKRVLEFCKLIENENFTWWAEGRIDTLNNYSEQELNLLSKSGCKMIFWGAETGDDEMLKKINKGGTVSGNSIKEFVVKAKNAGIIPELSFVLGMPDNDEKNVWKQINSDIKFIKQIKKINKSAEIIIYIYSPIPTTENELSDELIKSGFKFPSNIEDWLNPAWENFDLRKNPLTPWLNSKMINRVKNFETVLNARYPSISDFKIKGFKKFIFQLFAFCRYALNFYSFPYELRFLQKIWKYRKPETEGFYAE
ncbi:MAG: B12-binding domain-containing radical SAM protein [Bacteroidales bacterium]|nr:B12-binding domain-containing radical SAM protein [Bacteroidales bacterium]